MYPLLLDLEYRVRGGAARWALWAAAVMLAVAVLAAGAWQGRLGQQRLTLLQSEQEAVRLAAEAATPARVAAGDGVPAADFTAVLPDTPAAAEVVQGLSRACAGAGLVLASVQAAHRSASPTLLGRTELTVVLRGPYTAARRVLDDTLQRHPAVTLLRLRMRRASQPGDLETSATLSVWSRPAAAETGPLPAGRAP